MCRVGGGQSAANHGVRAVGVLVCFPRIAGRPNDDLLVVAHVFHLHRTDNQVLRFLDDHILQRHFLLLHLLAELQVRTSRLPEVHDPLLLWHRADHALRHMRQKL